MTVTSFDRPVSGRPRDGSGHAATTAALVVALCGLAVWAHALSDVTLADLGGRGLVDGLPAYSFVGLGLVLLGFGAAVARRRLHTPSLVAHTGVLIVALHGATLFFEPVLGNRISYRHAGIADYISTTGTVDPQIDAYFNWPGFFTFDAFLNEVAGIDNAVEIAKWAPIFYNLLYLLPLLLLFRTAASDERHAWIAVGVFYVGNWIGQDYFSPQATGYFLYLVIILIVVRWFGPRAGDGTPTWIRQLGVARLARRSDGPQVTPRTTGDVRTRALLLGVVVVLFAAVVPTHQLTPFMILAGVGALVLANRCSVRSLPIIMVVLVGAWIAFMTTAYLRGNFDELIRQVGDDDRVRIETEGDTQAYADWLTANRPGAAVVDGGVVTVSTPDGSRQLPVLLSAAAEQGLTVTSVDVVRPDLEDVFLSLTGRALRDD